MTRAVGFARQQRATIPDEIANEIQRQIGNGVLNEGDRLPSADELAREFGVSRASVREALNGLSALGIVDIQHGRGTFIRPGARRSTTTAHWIVEQQYALQELCELRLAVETTAARLAAVKATADDIAEIARAVAIPDPEPDDRDWNVQWDAEFHRAVIRAAHNRLLEQALAMSVDYLTQARRYMPSATANIEQTHAGHARVLVAIETRDPEAAALAMRDHLRLVEVGLGIHLP